MKDNIKNSPMVIARWECGGERGHRGIHGDEKKSKIK